jgi:hypothetical protein
MAFNPLDQPGMPVEDQFRDWSQLNPDPLPDRPEDPYTMSRVILMNGIEFESVMFSHQFARHTDDPTLLRALALSRRADHQQEKAVNWLLPGTMSPLETTIGYEQLAVDLTAWLARTEPDPNVKQALDFALLEDFDHLYRYADLYELIKGRNADELTQRLTEIMPGRPTEVQHRHPFDDLRAHYETHAVDPITRLHVMTITSGEQQTLNYYMNHGPDFIEPIARGLYSEIAEIEEQHVTHYESLLDPLDSWLAMWAYHEYMEVYLYWSFAAQETDPRVKALWELHLEMELGQLQVACRFLERYEGRDPRELLPKELPDSPVTLQSNKDYVREILATQIDLRSDEGLYVTEADLGRNALSRQYQATVNAAGVPTEDVIDLTRQERGAEYRDETEGPHPVESLRVPAGA